MFRNTVAGGWTSNVGGLAEGGAAALKALRGFSFLYRETLRFSHLIVGTLSPGIPAEHGRGWILGA